MRKTPEHVRRKVFQLWIEGYTYRVISQKLNISLGSIARIVDQFRRKRPDIDDLRLLNVQLRKTGSNLYDALRGATCIENLNKLDLSVKEIEDYKTLIDSVSENQDVKPAIFVKTAIKLMKLEAETGKTPTKIVKEFSEKQRKIENLKKKRDSLKTEMNSIDCELRTLKQECIKVERDHTSVRKALNRSIKSRRRLERLGLDKVERLAEFVESFESLGYDTKEIKELGNLKNVLQEIQIDAATLENFIQEKSQMNRQLAGLREQVRVLGIEVKNLERRRFRIKRETEITKVVSTVLKTQKTYVWCKRCGFTLIVPLPTRLDVMYYSMMNLAYTVTCNSCGFVNQMKPQEILANIGWMILE